MMATQSNGIIIDLTYQSEWQDGFGAQGWKLDVAMHDTAVIACTAYTGNKTPTSVLVHDILDHLISGFWLSGYKNEARSTAMHGLRNGIEVLSSYEWMTNEMLGAKSSIDQLAEFLPSSFTDSIPVLTAPEEKITFLLEKFALDDIRSHILESFFQFGLSGISIALSNWRDQRLDFERMHAIGLCLQSLLVEAQYIIKIWTAETAKGQILVGNKTCEFIVGTSDPFRQERIVKRVNQASLE